VVERDTPTYTQIYRRTASDTPLESLRLWNAESDPHQFDRRNSMVVTMTQKSSSVFLAGLFLLGLTAGVQAQGTQQVMPGSPAAVGGQQRGPVTGTAGVATGSGPLSQPTAPPATPGNRQWGPAQTQPLQQQPFGR
jgi:hypothetical protein